MPRKVKGCKQCGGTKPKGSGILFCDECIGKCPTHGRPKKSGIDCKDCRAAYMRTYLTRSPENAEQNRRRKKAKDYGITVEQVILYEAVTQCEVCGREGKMCIDHNHTTGEIRGVLCSPCNTALGHAGDNPVRLRALATYLEERGSY